MGSLREKIAEMRPALALVHLSAMGCLCVYAVQSYTGLERDPLICLVSMALIFGIYTYNRFTDLEEDFTNDISRVLFFQRKRIFLFIALSALGGSYLLLLAMGRLNFLHLSLLAIGVCYSYRTIPWWTPTRGLLFLRIKEMTFVKNLAVSFLWGACVFAVPILWSTSPVAHRELLPVLGLGLFLSTLNNTLFDDILDEPGDRVAGIRTLPTTVGVRGSYALLWILDAIWLVAMGGLWAFGALDAAHAGFLSLLALYPAVYMGLNAWGKAPRFAVDIFAESDLLVFATGMLLLA